LALRSPCRYSCAQCVQQAFSAAYHSDEHELVQFIARVGHSAISGCECTLCVHSWAVSAWALSCWQGWADWCTVGAQGAGHSMRRRYHSTSDAYTTYSIDTRVYTRVCTRYLRAFIASNHNSTRFIVPGQMLTTTPAIRVTVLSLQQQVFPACICRV
jgi:hypothetical protein